MNSRMLENCWIKSMKGKIVNLRPLIIVERIFWFLSVKTEKKCQSNTIGPLYQGLKPL